MRPLVPAGTSAERPSIPSHASEQEAIWDPTSFSPPHTFNQSGMASDTAHRNPQQMHQQTLPVTPVYHPPGTILPDDARHINQSTVLTYSSPNPVTVPEIALTPGSQTYYFDQPGSFTTRPGWFSPTGHNFGEYPTLRNDEEAGDGISMFLRAGQSMRLPRS